MPGQEVYRAQHVEHLGAGSAWCTYNNEGMSLITSSLYISGFCCGPFVTPAARKFGRKVTLLTPVLPAPA